MVPVSSTVNSQQSTGNIVSFNSLRLARHTTAACGNRPLTALHFPRASTHPTKGHRHLKASMPPKPPRHNGLRTTLKVGFKALRKLLNEADYLRRKAETLLLAAA
eukprot:498618-Pyramimonas_sp.AAC.1